MAKISLVIRGIPKTKEYKAKISLGIKRVGKRIPKTEEYKTKINAVRGRPLRGRALLIKV